MAEKPRTETDDETWTFDWSRHFEQISSIRAEAEKEDPPGEETLLLGVIEALRKKDRGLVDRAVCIVENNVSKDFVLRLSGAALFDLGFENEGVAILRQAVSTSADQTTLEFLAAALEVGGEYEEALQIYSRLLKVSSRNIYALVRRGFLLDDLHRWGEANKCFAEAVAISPMDPLARHMLAEMLVKRWEFRPALREYKKALKYGYDEPHAAWANIAYCNLCLGKLKKARRAVARALAIEPDYQDARRLLRAAEGQTTDGVDFFLAGIYDDLSYVLLKAEASAEKKPGKATLYLGAAKALRKGKIGCFEKAVRAVGNNVPRDFVLRVSGNVKYDLGREEEGLEEMRKAVVLNLDVENTIVLTSRLAMQAKCVDEARDLYQRLLVDNPKEWSAFWGLAALADDPNTGVSLYRKAIDINPNDEDIQYELGQALAELGNFREAIEEYKKALGLDGENTSETWAAIGECYFQLENYEHAKSCLEEALYEDPSNDYAMEILRKIECIEN